MCHERLPGVSPPTQNMQIISNGNDEYIIFAKDEKVHVTLYSAGQSRIDIAQKISVEYETRQVDKSVYICSYYVVGKENTHIGSIATHFIKIKDFDFENKVNNLLSYISTAQSNFGASMSLVSYGCRPMQQERRDLPRQTMSQWFSNRWSQFSVLQNNIKMSYQLQFSNISTNDQSQQIFAWASNHYFLPIIPAIRIEKSLPMKSKTNNSDTYMHTYFENCNDSGIENDSNVGDSENDCRTSLVENEQENADRKFTEGETIQSTVSEYLSYEDYTEIPVVSHNEDATKTDSNNLEDNHCVSSAVETARYNLIPLNTAVSSSACNDKLFYTSEIYEDSEDPSGDDESSPEEFSDDLCRTHVIRKKRQRQQINKSKLKSLRDFKDFRSLSSDDESKQSTSKHRARDRSFTRSECKELQRKVFEYSDNAGFILSEVSFNRSRVTIAYQTSDLSFDEKAVAEELRNHLSLERHQVKIILIENHSSARRTGADSPGSNGYVERNENAGGEAAEGDRAASGTEATASDRSTTKISSLITVECRDGSIFTGILSCGHDKKIGQEFKSATNFGQVLGTVSQSLYLNENQESMDLAIIAPQHSFNNGVDQQLACQQGVKPFVTATYRMNGLEKECRIYITEVLDKEPVSRMKVQTFQNNPREGIITKTFLTKPGDEKNPPIYNALKITDRDGRAIHGKGESGLLVTTKTDKNKIYQKMSADGTTVEYYCTFVKAVGILVAVSKDQNERKYSLALNIKESFDSFSKKFTEKYPSSSNPPVKIEFYVPNDIKHFLWSKPDSFEGLLSSGFNSEDEGGGARGAAGGARVRNDRERYTRIAGQSSEVDDSEYDSGYPRGRPNEVDLSDKK